MSTDMIDLVNRLCATMMQEMRAYTEAQIDAATQRNPKLARLLGDCNQAALSGQMRRTKVACDKWRTAWQKAMEEVHP